MVVDSFFLGKHEDAAVKNFHPLQLLLSLKERFWPQTERKVLLTSRTISSAQTWMWSLKFSSVSGHHPLPAQRNERLCFIKIFSLREQEDGLRQASRFFFSLTLLILSLNCIQGFYCSLFNWQIRFFFSLANLFFHSPISPLTDTALFETGPFSSSKSN